MQFFEKVVKKEQNLSNIYTILSKITKKSAKINKNLSKINEIFQQLTKTYKNQRKFVENHQKFGTKIGTVIQDLPKIFQFYAGFSKSRHPKNGIKVEDDCSLI